MAVGDFESFRRERLRNKRRQPGAGEVGFDAGPLRELQAYEARELHDQQVSREVQEFFHAATRQAASLVEKVAREAENKAGERIRSEMDAFLRDAMTRVTALVEQWDHGATDHSGAATPEQGLQPSVKNLGSNLDLFRNQGTASTASKHLGLNPLAVSVADVMRMLRGQATAKVADIEEHLVATATPEPEANEAELERLQAALRALVAQQTMSEAEAQAAWDTRLRAMQQQLQPPVT